MKNQLTENIFWNLSLRLELFTSFIPIPTFVYFIAVVGAFKTEEDIKSVKNIDLMYDIFKRLST